MLAFILHYTTVKIHFFPYNLIFTMVSLSFPFVINDVILLGNVTEVARQ